jgi:hypothetical protein
LRIANRKKCNYERVYCGEFQISWFSQELNIPE